MRIIDCVILIIGICSVVYYNMVAVALAVTRSSTAVTVFSVIMGAVVYASGYNTVRNGDNSRAVGSVLYIDSVMIGAPAVAEI